MHAISTALLNHLQQETTTVCTLWKVTRKDGQIFGFTNFDKDIIYNGLTYYAENGYSASAIVTNSNMAVDNLNLNGFLYNTNSVLDTSINLNSPLMTDADIMAGIWDFATIQILLVNYNDLTMGDLILKTGSIGQIKTGRTSYEAEMRSLNQSLSQKVGRVFTSACQAKLGDSNCRLNLTPYTFNGSVSEIINQQEWIDYNLNQTNSTQSASISTISYGTSTIITTTSNHGFQSGQVVTLNSIGGLSLKTIYTLVNKSEQNVFQQQFQTINGFTGSIVVLTPTTFQMNLNTEIYNYYYNSVLNQNLIYSTGGTATVQVVSEYFKYGTVKFLTGDNANLTFEIKDYNPNHVVLVENTIYPIQIGDTYQIVAGCDKIASTCNNRFNNIINFYGFNLIPGQDKLLSGQ
jgi:hypothetical protein